MLLLRILPIFFPFSSGTKKVQLLEEFSSYLNTALFPLENHSSSSGHKCHQKLYSFEIKYTAFVPTNCIFKCNNYLLFYNVLYRVSINAQHKYVNPFEGKFQH